MAGTWNGELQVPFSFAQETAFQVTMRVCAGEWIGPGLCPFEWSFFFDGLPDSRG